MSTALANPQRLDITRLDDDGCAVLEGDMVLSAGARAEVDMQISTAKRFPRSHKKFMTQAMEMATSTETMAAACIFSKPRAGKPIEGPSIRLAEICMSAWGNSRADAWVVGIEDEDIVAEALFWDLESNVAIRVQSRVRIVKANGERYKGDQVNVSGAAACSIALRNAIFRVIPRGYIQDLYEASRKAAIGDIKTLAGKRADMVAYFGKMGVPADRVFAAAGKSGIEDIGLDELVTLKGIATSIKDGELSVDEAFPDPKAPKPKSDQAALDEAKTSTSKLVDQLKATREKAAENQGEEINTAAGEVVIDRNQDPADAEADILARSTPLSEPMPGAAKANPDEGIFEPGKSTPRRARR